MDEYRLYVGIDWGSQEHAVCVLDGSRRVVEERMVAHSGEGIHELLEALAKRTDGEPSHIAVAIEVPRGPVVEACIDRGFHVFAINPKQLDRFRDRHSPAGAKDDRRDAFVLADSLRTDQASFRRIRLDDPLVVRLRELSRLDRDLEQQVRGLANRVRDQLLRYFPQILQLCSGADARWVWALLEQAPTPTKAARLGPGRIRKILREHRIRSVDADEVVRVLRATPLTVGPGVVEAACEHIQLVLPMLRLADEQRASCKRHLEQLLATLETSDGTQGEHRDAAILRSLPGVGTRVAAAVLGEASQLLAERDYHAMRGLSGAAPVTRQSGKKRTVVMRRACNAYLRFALFHWAACAVQHDAASMNYYRTLRARGHKRGRVLRAVADRLLRILFAMLRNRELYEPNRARRVHPGAPSVPGEAA